jgi:hypothetical protein
MNADPGGSRSGFTTLKNCVFFQLVKVKYLSCPGVFPGLGAKKIFYFHLEKLPCPLFSLMRKAWVTAENT